MIAEEQLIPVSIASPPVLPWWKAMWDAILMNGLATFLVFVLFVIAPVGLISPVRTEANWYDLQLIRYGILLVAFESLLALILLRYPLWPAAEKRQLLSWVSIRSRKISLILATALITGYLIAGCVQQFLAPSEPTEFVDYMIYAMSTPSAPLVVIGAIVSAPVAEELMFRGFLQSSFQHSFLGFWGSAGVLSMVWSLLHGYDWPATFLVAGFGVSLAWLRKRSCSLLPGIYAHASLNLVVLANFWLLPRNIH